MKRGYCILAALLIELLAVCNLHLWVNEQKPDYTVRIGKPNIEGANFVASVDFTESEPLRSKADVDTVLFSLISGNTIQEPFSPSEPPDGVLFISDSAGYGIGYHVTVWLDGETAIFAMGLNEHVCISITVSSLNISATNLPDFTS